MELSTADLNDVELLGFRLFGVEPGDRGQVRKLPRPGFDTKRDHFTKTGSGQTQETLKQRP
eukprot:COSAG06_NODE_1112_length_10647_cov_8.424820_6_plen_61_part_00